MTTSAPVSLVSLVQTVRATTVTLIHAVTMEHVHE